MPSEIELKLALDPKDADILAASGRLGGEPKKTLQRSIYFDTPDRDLAKAGLSLRIRNSGGLRVQTVKARGADAAGLFARAEWEQPVAGDSPVLDDAPSVRALLRERSARLAPAFTVEVERIAWDVRDGDTMLEAVLDRGEVVADDRRSPICEVELELKSGDAAALFDLAHKLDAAAPVRLGVLTKAERGYALLGPLSLAYKAEEIALAADVTAGEAFDQIVRSCVRQFRLNEDVFRTSESAEGLHQARVALRRLRTAFWIFRTQQDSSKTRKLRNELRWLATALGEARSIDALIEHGPDRGTSCLP